MITVSSPLVVKLFGEHAVVYGRRAIACAISTRMCLTIEEAEREGVTIAQEGGEKEHVEKVDDHVICSSKFSYILAAVKIFQDEVIGRPITKLTFKTRCDVPPSCGLATSAAVSVCTLYALSKWYNVTLDLDYLAKLGHRVELTVQGRASPMDTYTTTHGGVTLIHPARGTLTKIDIDVSKFRFVIGVVRRRRTTRELVAKVAEMYYSQQNIVDMLLDCIDKICEEALQYMQTGDIVKLGQLMYLNHYILSALGVSNVAVDTFIGALRELNIPGAKVSGAGDGGTILILVENDLQERTVKEKLREIFRNDLILVVPVTVDQNGVREERSRH